jgi:hypothetical protein
VHENAEELIDKLHGTHGQAPAEKEVAARKGPKRMS